MQITFKAEFFIFAGRTIERYDIVQYEYVLNLDEPWVVKK